MKAYVLRNNELELVWSWESERQPSSEAPAVTSPEIPGDSAPNGSASPADTLPSDPLENGDAVMQVALGALNAAIGIKQAPDAPGVPEPQPVPTPTSAQTRQAQTLEEWVEAAVAAISGAIRQQGEEIQELREQLGRVENETKSCSAQIQALQSRVDILDERVHPIFPGTDSTVRVQSCSANEPRKPQDRVENTAQPDCGQAGKPESRVEEMSQQLDVAIASDQGAPKEPEVAAGKPNEPTADEPRRMAASRRPLWRRLTWVVIGGGIPLASWWAYAQRGIIDVIRDPDPPPIFIAKIPTPPPTEAPKVSEPASPAVASQSVSVLVTAKEEIWLEAETDGNKVFAKVLLANQTKSFDASRQIKILTGNLAGTDVSYNGKQIGRLGNRHSVGAFIFTPQGWRDASAREARR
jgi:hypothetical protein